MTVKPTIFFVHGAWHSPAHYQRIRSLFHQNDFPTHCPPLPTCGGPAETDMYQDAKLIRTELEKLVEDGKEIVVICHSYGGVVTTEAVDESLGKNARASKGLPGGVLRLIYMTAFMLPQGQALVSPFGGTFPPVMYKTDDGYCHITDPAQLFYHDLPEEEQKHWISELKCYSSTAVFTTLTYAAYKYHPLSYIYCTDDKALPYELQKAMVQDSGVHVDEHTCSASHSPFLSQPEAILQAVSKTLM